MYILEKTISRSVPRQWRASW